MRATEIELDVRSQDDMQELSSILLRNGYNVTQHMDFQMDEKESYQRRIRILDTKNMVRVIGTHGSSS